MVTTLTLTSISSGLYRLAWASDLSTPVFRVYRDGSLLSVTQATSMDVSVGAGESPVFDVIDDGETSPAAYPPRVVLQWFTVSGAVSYRIEQYIASTWTKIGSVKESGLGYYQFTTNTLQDDTTHQFRVVPVSTAGNDGTPTTFSVLMVRYPDPPDATFAYSSGTGKVTIS